MATSQFDISFEQFHIMRLIRKGTRSVSELAEVRQISRPAISQSVDALVEKGLITRQQNAEDRRYIELDLTQAGNEMINTMFGSNRHWMMEKMASLSPEELDTIQEAMKILKSTFTR